MENENKIIPESTLAEAPEITTPPEQAPEENIIPSTSIEPETPVTPAPIEKRCPNCQALLTEEQLFCAECGASYKKLCVNCKAELQDNQAFCSACGCKNEQFTAPTPGIAEFNAGIQQKQNKKKLIPVLIGAALACIVVLYFVFTVFMNPQHYIEKGNYLKAYDVAGNHEKEAILHENAVAVVSADCAASLKDPYAFELRDAYVRVNDSSRIIILKAAANNSYGNRVINYWYYTYNKDEEKYELFTSFVDFTEEKSYSWDTSSEKLEKSIKNLSKVIAKSVIEDGYQLPTEAVNNINALFQKGILQNVTLIDVTPQPTEN